MTKDKETKWSGTRATIADDAGRNDRSADRGGLPKSVRLPGHPCPAATNISSSLRNADLHDLRDTETSRENYVASSVATGHQAQSQTGAAAGARKSWPSRVLDEVVDD